MEPEVRGKKIVPTLEKTQKEVVRGGFKYVGQTKFEFHPPAPSLISRHTNNRDVQEGACVPIGANSQLQSTFIYVVLPYLAFRSHNLSSEPPQRI